jgi:hypothetical protein
VHRSTSYADLASCMLFWIDSVELLYWPRYRGAQNPISSSYGVRASLTLVWI